MTTRTVLITGSTAGIGAAIATAFARNGHVVWVNGRDRQRTEDAARRIADEAGAGQVRAVAADIATAEGAAAIQDQLPDVDILVNNAGVFEPQPFTEITDDDWRRYFEVNVLSGIRLTRRYLPGMVSRDWGRVVFISSESAVNIPTEMIHYGVTKTAQVAAARGIAQEVAGTGVTVNSVLPGPTLTEGAGPFLAGIYGDDVPIDEAQRRFIDETRPTSIIKRFATPAEVAAMVRYVCSDDASATTGAALRVDGGVMQTIFP